MGRYTVLVFDRIFVLLLLLVPMACRSRGAPVDAAADQSNAVDIRLDQSPAETTVDAGPPPNPICLPSGWCWQNPLPMGGAMVGAWGTSTDNVWAVGSGGTILHWNGMAWSFFDSGTTETLVDIWGSG